MVRFTSFNNVAFRLLQSALLPLKSVVVKLHQVGLTFSPQIQKTHRNRNTANQQCQSIWIFVINTLTSLLFILNIRPDIACIQVFWGFNMLVGQILENVVQLLKRICIWSSSMVYWVTFRKVFRCDSIFCTPERTLDRCEFLVVVVVVKIMNTTGFDHSHL